MAFSLFHQKNLRSQRGFTLIELIVVIAIIAILSVLIGFSIIEMIKRGKIAKAQGDINRIVKAIRQLEADTNFMPNKESATGCTTSGGLGGSTNEIYFLPNDASLANSGLFANFSTPTNLWKGPYLDGTINELSTDPWGKPYVYDGDYECVAGVKGCERYIGGGTDDRAVTSYGIDRTQYTKDDLVYVFCGSN